MKRWSEKEGKTVENLKVDAFLVEIKAVCKSHGFSISQEDTQGGFEICRFDEDNIEWLEAATDRTQ